MFHNFLFIPLLLYELQLSRNKFHSHKNILEELGNHFDHQMFELNHKLLIFFFNIKQNFKYIFNRYQTFKPMENHFLAFFHQPDIQQLQFLRIQNYLDL